MTKFSKFLEEDRLDKKQIKEKDVKNEGNSKYSSLKIKMDTLDTLRKVKLITGEYSYSILIEKMLESYIKELSVEEREHINILLNT